MTEKMPAPVEQKGSLPTLADVAEYARVSTATVSRCLNSPDRVNESTKKRVLEAVEKLGYAPNFGARALAARQTNTIGAVIPTMENAVFARGLQAFQEELGRHGKTLIVASSAYDAALEDEQLRALVARGADALLLIGYDRSESLYDFLDGRNVPTLIAWSFDKTNQRPAIGFDNRAAMKRLAREVIAKGHQHIACISAPTKTNDRARERVEGIKAALVETGQDPEKLMVTEVPYGIANGDSAFNRILTTAPQTTAVMCVNDVLAVGAVRAAKSMGLRVPDDVSITGFDDIELSTLTDPALTTVHVPHREMGQKAAQMLVQMLERRETPGNVALPTELRLRGSLTAPRA